MSAEADEVAIGVTANDLAEHPVVPFCGWVQEEDGVSIRIYDSPRFDEFYEIKQDDVRYQIPGSQRPHDNGRSAIWVNADAPVRMGRTGTALYFHERDKQRRTDDPAGWSYRP